MHSRRRVLIQITLPAILIGTALLFVCGFGVQSLNKLQQDRERVLARDVAALQAAQEVQLRLRQIQYHGFLYVLQTTEQHRLAMEEDHAEFEIALQKARRAVDQPEQQQLVELMEANYLKYRHDIEDRSRWPRKPVKVSEAVAWGIAHPIRQLLGPCSDLIRLHQESIEQTRQQNALLTSHTQTLLILLAVGGILGGLLIGGVAAWGLSQSITRLRLQIQIARRELDIGIVSLVTDRSLDSLDHEMAGVVEQVRNVVAQMQNQERELLRTEQLAAVGQLAAGLAHEIRNPLTGVKLLIEASLRSHATLTSDELEMTRTEILRIERTVQGLLDFARMPEMNRQPHELGELVCRAIETILPRAQAHGVRIDYQKSLTPFYVFVDSDQVLSLLTNLLINGIEACKTGGVVTIELSAREPHLASVSVRDSGAGIDPRIVDRLFTPFVTTKAHGTGLGLSTARRIAEAHGGSLEITPHPGPGACMTWTVPTSEVSLAEVDDCG